MNHNKKINLSILFVFTLLIIVPLASADWTRAYCLYNSGAGSSVCDSGNINGDTASCDTTGKCSEEGDIFCYAESDFTVGGYVTDGPVIAENINWDGDSNDCTCHKGAGLWSLGGEVATTSCCGDDANENKITETGSTDAPAGYNDKITTCCNSNTDCTYNDACTTSGGVSSPATPNKAYCFSGLWYGGDYTSTACTAITGSNRWNLGGETAATDCCGDDAGEQYIGPDNGRSCDGTNACCNSASDYVQNGACVSACYRWENLFGNEIKDGNKGDAVRMALENTGLSEGSEVEFEIYEGGDSIRTGTSAITGTVDGGIVIAYWTITQEDLDKTASLTNFFFKTDFSSDVSNSLSISTSYNNTPTTIGIISPSCGEYFDAGPGLRPITISANDEDDSVEGNLSVNDIQIGTFKNGDTIINHVFSIGGNYKIVAEAINSRGQKKRIISNVMAIDTTVDGEYAAACITQPEDYSNIPTSYVEFDASDSLGIKYISGVTTEIGLSGLSFNWSFSDGRTNPSYLGTNPLSYSFSKNFYTVGSNWATLKVSIL